ncbi:hypothetical protein [Thalassotalea ganghwensis]
MHIAMVTSKKVLSVALVLSVSNFSIAQETLAVNKPEDTKQVTAKQDSKQSIVLPAENQQVKDSKGEAKTDSVDVNKLPNKKNDSFVPSEEISEDLAVSFPVDI